MQLWNSSGGLFLIGIVYDLDSLNTPISGINAAGRSSAWKSFLTRC